MITTKNHYIEIYINKQKAEIISQENLNLRINDVLFNPAKTNTSQATYSFSFDIPSTPINDKIFSYASILSKINKFHARYEAEVYADGINIFTGSLTVNKYNYNEKVYECNLVNIKIYSLEDIFGEKTLNQVHWELPFDGATTINRINNDASTKVYFPFLSYGCFQKYPVYEDEVGADYTSKFEIDKYNKWWIDSFYPSLNCMEYIKKAFTQNGYNVNGNAFYDPVLNNIYMSTNLADEQIPVYNLGHEKFGHLSLSSHWSNGTNKNNKYNGYINHSLNYPYMLNGVKTEQYKRILPLNIVITKPLIDKYDAEHPDFESIDIYNVLDSANTHSNTSINEPSYMYDPNERIIVIPADGWYRITLTCNASLLLGDGDINADHWYWWDNGVDGDMHTDKETLSFKRNTPFELQLIRNNEGEDVELIYGKNKDIRFCDYTDKGKLKMTYQDILTCYPHEALYWQNNPTKEDELSTSNIRNKVKLDEDGYKNLGYVYKDGESMAYDPQVNEKFICGMSTLSSGTTSIIKNGKSWTRLYESENKSIYNTLPYNYSKFKINEDGSERYETGATQSYNRNSYINAPADYANVTDTSFSSKVSCLVKLNKNDVLELKAVLRHFDNTLDTENAQTNYYVDANIDLDILAVSPNSYEHLRQKPVTYEMDTEFPANLQLNEFLNNETKIAEWINDFAKAFNLSISQNGNNIDISTNIPYNKNINGYAVDINNKFMKDSVESEYISYPREMAVKYSINTDEWGFEKTVPTNHINDDDWKEWGDSGYTVIKLNDDAYETSTNQIQVKYSYTYYDTFTLNNEYQPTKQISIPVIERSQYMADGYGYEDAMQHDGYSLTQRFWFRQTPSEDYVYTSDMLKDKIYLTYPINSYNGVNLSYKDTEKSILTEYFNISPMLSSNYVNVETYLTPDEYIAIKGGAYVYFDEDIYLVSEINGYSPDGHDVTELKLIKKI